MADLTPVVVAVIMAAGAIGGTLLTLVFARREKRVAVQVDMGQLSHQWAESFREDAQSAKADAKEARASADAAHAEVLLLRNYIHTLVTAMREHGIEPPQFPDRVERGASDGRQVQ